LDPADLAEPSEMTFWTLLGGAAGILGVGGLAVWYFQETLKRILPTPLRIARRLRTRDIVPGEGTRFTILIADLDGDDDQLSQTRHVEAALRAQEGVEVVLIGSGPSPFEKGSRAEHQIRAESQGRERLARHNGDLLIWGEVAQANTRLRLHFLPRQEGVEGKRGTYHLEAAELPKDFSEDFNAQLVALALASLAPVTEQQGSYLVDLLKQPAGKLERLLKKGAPGFDPDQIAGLRLALARVALTLGEQTGDVKWLRRSIDEGRKALEQFTRDRLPMEWARAQNNLGIAFTLIGRRESGTSHLEEAVAAYRAALEEYPRERLPLNWAMTQNNLGNALMVLGEREGSTARLEEAVAAFRAALEEWARERVPLDWAMAQTNLGNALALLGKRERGIAHLEEAVAAYRAALEERTRDRVPLDWAATQSNLGNALRVLGEREAAATRLEDAVIAYRAALEERTRERVPLQWAESQNNLGTALKALGEREAGRDAAGGSRSGLPGGARGVYA
jgi:tetratricopeptide (TPR) repeat protein